ncbi:MAG TPA: LysM peptidoglycan-binding domain-containing protein [Planctomycetes bacterium]|nr:LysM peptidoglycan-binding domain-containing protein [Fuerstiella sp.]HIK92171.1 LysM peptidoglycan-binding domain-containing protein [Planctomycetota bacterium]
MEPFAYKKPQSSGNRKLIGLVLAMMLAVWYFDIIPEVGTVPTGGLDSEVLNPNLNDADFLAMLDALPADDIADNTNASSLPQKTEDDPLQAALASQVDPLEEVFPEFAEPPLPVPTKSSANPNQTQAVTGGIQQAVFAPAKTPRREPAIVQTVLSPEVAATLRNADQWVTNGETLEAHAALSRLYWKQPEFRAQIYERIEKTAAEIYANPTAHFAEPHFVEFGDTLESIAQKYQVPWQYLARLNSTSPETLQAGQKLKVLNGPFGAVVDLNSFEMTIHAHGWYVHRYRIGVGKDQGTPVGEFTVQIKRENPKWVQPNGQIVAADDPHNPLGEYWIGLGEHIGIHGTIAPESIGTETSRGCIHLADGDITEVFNLLGAGSKVVIRR